MYITTGEVFNVTRKKEEGESLNSVRNSCRRRDEKVKINIKRFHLKRFHFV